MHYYFAYGSNMDETQMEERCPENLLLGKAVLNDFRLGFTIYSPKRKCGCADILASPGHKVYGVLYLLTERDLQRLDMFEGAPDHYRRIKVPVQSDAAGMIEASTYEVVMKSSDFITPSVQYMDQLVRAAGRFHFPDNYQQFLAGFRPKPV